MKIYLSGGVHGSYRAQNIIKVLGDNGISYFNLPLIFHKTNLKFKFFTNFFSLIFVIFTSPFRISMILSASHFFVLPMNSTLLSLIELFCAKLFKKKIIIDYYISEYDTSVNDRKTIKKNSLNAKWALFKDSFFLNLADKIIFLNKSEAIYYQSINGVVIDESKIIIVPLCVDFKKEMFDCVNNKGAKKTFDVCWWGTYIPLHGLENLIKAFSLIHNNKIRLFIFGDSEEKATPFFNLIHSLNLQDKIFLKNDFTFANGKLAPFLKAQCDLAIGNFGDSSKAKTVLVNKVVDALSLGIPSLTMRTKAANELFNQNEGLIFTSPEPERIADSILKAYHGQYNLEEIAKNGKKKYLDLFCPDAFKISLLALLNE